MYQSVEQQPPVEREIEIFTKTGNNTKRSKGKLKVKFKPVSTSEVRDMIDEDLMIWEIFEEVVLEVGPVGHPTEKDEQGNPVPLPPAEAMAVVKEDWPAVQQIVADFWELHRVDPKSATSRKQRRRG